MAAWTAQQIVEAFAWETLPRFLQRDRDNLDHVLVLRPSPSLRTPGGLRVWR
jgi:hypothetical protein